MIFAMFIPLGNIPYISLGDTLLGYGSSVNRDKHVQLILVKDSDTPEQRVGARIRDQRVALGLSQEDLAKAMRYIGYTWQQTTVAKTEAADRPLRVNEIVDLANVLGVAPAELLGETLREFDRTAAIMRLLQAKDDAQRLMAKIESLKRQERQLAEEHGDACIRAATAEAALRSMGADEVDGSWVWPEVVTDE